MGKKPFVIVLVVFLIAGGYFLNDWREAAVERRFSNPGRIAHAGGGFVGETYTNSLEALDFNYRKGFRLFEIDFNWTNDDSLVCVHDWQTSFWRSYGFSSGEIPSKKKFVSLKRRVAKYRMLTLEELAEWFIQHPEARLITDVKSNNLKALKVISERMRHNLNRVIPQIYGPEEYQRAKEIGYQDIIWTLYRDKRFDDQITDVVQKMDLFAVTMPVERAKPGTREET